MSYFHLDQQQTYRPVQPSPTWQFSNDFSNQRYQESFTPHQPPGLKQHVVKNTRKVSANQYPISVEQFLWCIDALYFSTNQYPEVAQRNQRYANQWLLEFQTNELATSICAFILRTDSTSTTIDPNVWTTAQLLASQTLHKRLKRKGLLNPDLEKELKGFLFQALRSHRGHKAIETQLCLCITALAVRGRCAWESTNIIPHFFNQFPSSQNQGGNMEERVVLLKLFQILPEQCMDVTISVSKSRKEEIIRALCMQSKSVLEFLETCARTTDSTIQSQVIQTFNAWIKLGAVPVETLESDSLFLSALQTITHCCQMNESGHQTVSNHERLICDATEVISSSSTRYVSQYLSAPGSVPMSLQQFFAKVIFEVLAPASIALSSMCNDDIACTVADCLVHVGVGILDCQLRMFQQWVSAVQQDSSLGQQPTWAPASAFQAIHQVTSQSKSIVCMCTFPFWTKFHEQNVQMVHLLGASVLAGRSQVVDDVAAALQEKLAQVRSLLEELVPLGMFPDDNTYRHRWGSEEREVHKLFRRELRETVRLLATPSQLIETVNRNREEVSGILVPFVTWSVNSCYNCRGSFSASSSSQLLWRELESVLHGLSAIARVASRSSSCDDLLSRLFDFLSDLCEAVNRGLTAHRALMRTVAITSGVLAFNGWLDGHTEKIDKVLTIIQCTLNIQEEDDLYPFRDGEDHSGSVALMKLVRSNTLAAKLCSMSLNEDAQEGSIASDQNSSVSSDKSSGDWGNRSFDIVDPKFINSNAELFRCAVIKGSPLDLLFTFYLSQASFALEACGQQDSETGLKLSQNSLELIFHSLISAAAAVDSTPIFRAIFVTLCLPHLVCVREARELASHASNQGASLWDLADQAGGGPQRAVWLRTLDRAIMSLSSLRVAFTAIGAQLTRQVQLVDSLRAGMDQSTVAELEKMVEDKKHVVAQLAAAEWTSYTVFLATLALRPPLPVVIAIKSSPDSQCDLPSTPPHYARLLASMCHSVPSIRKSKSNQSPGTSPPQYVREKPVFEVNERRDHLVFQLCQTLIHAVSVSPIDFHPAVPVLARMLLRGMHFLKGEGGFVCIIDNFESVCMITLLDRIVFHCGNTNGASAAALLDVVGHVTAAFLEQCEMDKTVRQRMLQQNREANTIFERSPFVCASYFHLASSMVAVWCGKGIDTRAVMYIGVPQWLEVHRSELSTVVSDALRCAAIGLQGQVPDRAVAGALLHFLNEVIQTSGEKNQSTSPAVPSLSNPVVSWWSGQIEALLGSGLGVEIARGLFIAASGGMQSWMIDRITMTLQAFALRFRDHIREWLTVALSDVNIPKPSVSADAKVAFIEELLGPSALIERLGPLKKVFKAFSGGKRKGETPRPSKKQVKSY